MQVKAIATDMKQNCFLSSVLYTLPNIIDGTYLLIHGTGDVSLSLCTALHVDFF